MAQRPDLHQKREVSKRMGALLRHGGDFHDRFKRTAEQYRGDGSVLVEYLREHEAMRTQFCKVKVSFGASIPISCSTTSYGTFVFDGLFVGTW